MSRVDARQELQTLAARVQSARQALQIYPPRHPQLDQALEECFAKLLELLGNDPRIQIALADREFVLGNMQVPATGEVLEEFAVSLRALGINKLIFKSGVRRWELQRLLNILSTDLAEVVDKGVEQLLAAANVENIEAGTISIDTTPEPDPDVLFRTWEAYGVGVKAVRGVKERARALGSLGDIGELRDFAHRITALSMQESRPLLAVHALKSHDEYTFTHSTNVAMLTSALARCLPLKREALHEITVAALLHDVGKERVPREILQKPGALTAEEWVIMNRHGVEGARMLAQADGVGDLAPIVAFEHHLAYHPELREDPDWGPHLVSQLVCLADVYDALRSNRAYRQGLPPDESMRIMKDEAGSKFDPLLFDGFYRLLGSYPPGTIVRLTSGAVAVAFANNPEAPDQPQVVVARDARGEACPEPPAMDLFRTDSGEKIVGLVSHTDSGINPLDYL